MEAGGTLTTAAGDLGKQINSCSEQVSGIGTWEGPSHDSITEQVESFVGEYTAISSQLTALGEACDEYIKYAELYRQMKATEQEMNAAKEDNKADYRDAISQMKDDLETLKGNISGALSDAASPSLEASALSANVSGSVLDSDKKTSVSSTASVDLGDGLMQSSKSGYVFPFSKGVDAPVS